MVESLALAQAFDWELLQTAVGAAMTAQAAQAAHKAVTAAVSVLHRDLQAAEL